jgi:hypothetical protein
MRRTVMGLIFILCIAGAASAQTVPNAGMENWTGGAPDGWSGDTNLVAEENADLAFVHGGTKSAKLTINTTSTDNGTRDFVTTDFITGLTEGQEYTSGVSVYDNDPDTSVRLQFHFYDTGGTELDGGTPAYGDTYSSDQASWQQLLFTRTAPTGTVKCKIGVRGYRQSSGINGPGQIVYVDDFSLISGTPSATDVANIAAARSTGGAVRITGTVTVNCGTAQLNGTRNQFYIQDSSGADGQSGLCVDDPTTQATHVYYPGDRLANITGTMGSYAGAAQLQLSADPGAATPGTPPAPLVVTLPIASIDAIEGELVRIDTVHLVGGAAGSYAQDNYDISDGTNTIVMRIEDASQLFGTPKTPGIFDVIGIATEFNASKEIEPRFLTDIIPFTGTAVSAPWHLYE